MSAGDRALIEVILRTDFQSFLHRCFLTLNPGVVFLPNWHLKAMGAFLESTRKGATNRLIINAPPRQLKSLVASVAFPAFVLGHEPCRRIMAISYGTELANKHARDFRSIVELAWYRRIFPNMKIVRSLDDEVTTSQGGFRKATSIEGTLTGLGGDMFVIDDPQKPADAQSETRRKKVNDWVANTLMSRLDNKETGVIIVVMQRVHMDDLSGFLLSRSNDWEHLSLPAIAEADEESPIAENDDYHRRAGEVLHPAHESLETLLKLQNQIGSYDFAAQYQQSPIPPGGGMIKKNWLRYYKKHELPGRTYRTKILQSWDCAAKEGVNNDYSVCTTWQVYHQKSYYLLDMVRGRWDYPTLKAQAIAHAKRYEPDWVLIEDTSTGTALAQELKVELTRPVKPVSVDRDKVGRLYVEQAKFEAGLVHFPEGAPFLADLEAELLTFPQSRHDDIVDSISQALHHKFGYDSTYDWL